MGQIYVDTPQEGRVLVNIAGATPTEEEQRMITEKFFSEPAAAPVVQEPVVQEPVVQEPVVQEPVVEAEAFVPRFPGDTPFQQELVSRSLPQNDTVSSTPVVSDAEGWQAEADKIVAENTQTEDALTEAEVTPSTDAEDYNARGFLNELQKGTSAADIVEFMYTQGTDVLEVDGKPYDLKKAVEDGGDPQEIMDFLLTGKVIRDVGAVTATVMGVNTGITSFAGMPFELSNWLTRKAEQGVRSGINAIAGTELSTKPEDMTFSRSAEEGALLSGDNIRAGLRDIGAVDIPDSKREIPVEYRSLYQAGRVVGENLLPAAGLYKLALTNAIKIGANPNMHPFVAAMAKNPSAFLKGEAVAILGGAIGSGTAENLAPDNPYWSMGGEIIGSVGIGTGTAVAKAVVKNSPLALVGRTVKQVFAGMGTEAARKAAAQEILIALDATKTDLLNRAKVAVDEGRDVDATALKAEADAYTVDNVLAALAASQKSDGFAQLPAGTGSDNIGLLGIQNTLMKTSERFKVNVNDQINEALAGQWSLSTQLLKNEGTRRMGELMQTRYIQNILQKEMLDKGQTIQDVLKTIPKGDMEAASVAVQNILREGKTNLRKMETFWWDRINKATLVDVSEVAKAIRAQQAKMPEGANVASGEANTVLSTLLSRAEAGEALSAGEILKQRSYFLDLAREAGGNSQFKAADRYDEIAGSLIDVLNAIDGPDKDVIDMARKFSLKLNETYNRYWIKDTLASASGGGTARDPRLTLQNATSGNASQTNLNLRDSQEAADYTDSASIGTERQQMIDIGVAKGKQAASEVEPELNTLNLELTGPPSTALGPEGGPSTTRMREMDKPKSGDEARVREDATGNVVYDTVPPRPKDAPPGNDFDGEGVYSLDNEEVYGQLMPLPERQALGPSMNAAQRVALQNEIRDLADASVRDGIPTPEALNRWLSDNSELIERFPEVKDRATQLITAQEEAATLVAKVDKFSTTEKFNNSVAEVFASDNPSQGFTELVETIRTTAVRQGEDPAQALDQLRASTFDMMITSANKGDEIDFVSLSNQLFAPLDNASTGATRMDIMIKNGLMDEDTSKAVASLMFESIRIQKSTAQPRQFNQIMQDSETMINNIARLAGANVGVMFGKGDASLQAAAIGSAFMKNLVDKLPAKKKAEQMEFLFLNPNLLSDYISKNPVIQKRATDKLREGLGRIQTRVKDQGYIGAPLSYIWDGVKYVAKSAVTSTVNRATKPSVATIGALEGDGEVDPNRLPSNLETQMQGAFQ